MSEYDDFKNGDGFNEYIEFLKGNKEYMRKEVHSPEKRNGSSGLTARRSASVERCKMSVTRD